MAVSTKKNPDIVKQCFDCKAVVPVTVIKRCGPTGKGKFIWICEKCKKN